MVQNTPQQKTEHRPACGATGTAGSQLVGLWVRGVLEHMRHDCFSVLPVPQTKMTHEHRTFHCSTLHRLADPIHLFSKPLTQTMFYSLCTKALKSAKLLMAFNHYINDNHITCQILNKCTFLSRNLENICMSSSHTRGFFSKTGFSSFCTGGGSQWSNSNIVSSLYNFSLQA